MMVNHQSVCPECRAPLAEDETCEAHFHTLLAWEWEYAMPDVHHLLVLVYHMQHPRLYSPETLRESLTMLAAFVEDGVSPQMMQARLRHQVDSGARKHKITGTPEHHGRYMHPVAWTMHVGDVIRAGPEAFYAGVRAWAAGSLDALRTSGNLSA
jgi:hypothetical protein